MEFTKEIKTFALYYGISRAFLLFIPASLPDIPYVSLSLDAALFAKDLSYPPLFQIQLVLFFFLFGPTFVGFRIGIMFYEVGCLVVIFKLAYLFQQKEFQKPEQEAMKSAVKTIYIFSFFPNIIFNYSGSVEFVATFLMLLGLFAYYQNKIIRSSIFFSLGVLMEIYPIFCLIPIVVHYIFRKQVKLILKISGVFILTFILGSLPFYILNPTNFLDNYFVQFSRVPKAESLWIIPFDIVTNWNLITFGNLITISPIGIGFLIWFLTYVLITFVYFFKNKEVSMKEEFALIATFTLLLPLIFLSLYPRYIFLGLPIVFLLYDTNLEYRRLLALARNISIVIIVSAIITLSLWPELLTSTIQQNLSTLNNFEVYFFLFYGMYLCICYIWIKSPRKIDFFISHSTRINRNLILIFSAFFVQILLITGPIHVWISIIDGSGFTVIVIRILCFGLAIIPLCKSIFFIKKTSLWTSGGFPRDKI